MIGMHETVICSESASIGVGLSMGPFGVIHAEARIGDRCVFGQSVMIGSRVVIGHGCKIQNN
ncbi:MAG: N-acetyltransferase, partial [bacterium]|nr:N-acetyltransferase [bacterium]